MLTRSNSFLRSGIYTVPEASRLAHVSGGRIRRWLRGYEFQTKSGRHRSPVVWAGQLDPIDHSLALGFLDLIEVRCIDALRTAGVSWKTLRRAHTRSRELFRHDHPFSTNRFATDGHSIFMEFRDEENRTSLWDLAEVQRVFDRIIIPFLKNLEFENDQTPVRWWPLGQNRGVALDPKRNFGHPIVFETGVPTLTLARSVKAHQSIQEVARWFEISPKAVKEAVEFEQQLAA